MRKFNDPSKLPSVEYLKECFIYDSESGLLTWKKRPLHHFKNSHGMNTFNSKYSGSVCKSSHICGYITMSISSKKYLAHRVIWKLMTGDDANDFIDHIDGNKKNNSFSNLRLASKQQNAYNCKRSCKNKTGFKGVSFDSQRNKYYACINIRGKTISLGRHITPELAHEAYVKAAKHIHGNFLRTE